MNAGHLRIAQVNVPPRLIDLGIGQPDFSLLPGAIMRRAASARLADDPAAILNYGAEQGDGYFRRALSRFLTAQYDRPVTMDELFVTGGASQALDLTCTLFTQPGDTVFAEEPAYFLALRIFQDHGLRVVGIPTDDQGMEMGALRAALEQEQPVFVYTIPTFQNPTGATLPAARRRMLVELAQEHGFLVVADEVYHSLHYQTTPPPPLAAHTDGERVISLGSFSKILAPGLRLGWVQTAPALLERYVLCGLVDSGGGLNPFTSALVTTVLEEGWQDEHLTHLRRVYAARVEAVDRALQRDLGDTVHYTRPAGGFFFWLTLPDGVDAEALLPTADRAGVGFVPGPRFSSRQRLRNCLRLSFAFYAEAQINAGVARLAQVIHGAVD